MTDIGFPSPENVIYMDESLTTTRSRVFKCSLRKKTVSLLCGYETANVFFEKWENLNSMAP